MSSHQFLSGSLKMKLTVPSGCHGSDHAISRQFQHFRPIRMRFLGLEAQYRRLNCRRKPRFALATYTLRQCVQCRDASLCCQARSSRSRQKPNCRQRSLPTTDPIAARRLLNLAIPAVFPFARMLDHSGAQHVQIDIHNALMQMIIGLDSRSVIPVLPPWRFLPDCILAPSARRLTACPGL